MDKDPEKQPREDTIPPSLDLPSTSGIDPPKVVAEDRTTSQTSARSNDAQGNRLPDCCNLHVRSQTGWVLPSSFVGFRHSKYNNVYSLCLPTEYKYADLHKPPTIYKDDLKRGQIASLRYAVLSKLHTFDKDLFELAPDTLVGPFRAKLHEHIEALTTAWYESHSEPGSRCDSDERHREREALSRGFKVPEGSVLQSSYIWVKIDPHEDYFKPVKPLNWIAPRDNECLRQMGVETTESGDEVA